MIQFSAGGAYWDRDVYYKNDTREGGGRLLGGEGESIHYDISLVKKC